MVTSEKKEKNKDKMAKSKDFIPIAVSTEPKVPPRPKVKKISTDADPKSFLNIIEEQLIAANTVIDVTKSSDQMYSANELKYYLQCKELLVKVFQAVGTAKKMYNIADLESNIANQITESIKKALANNQILEAIKYLNLLKTLAVNDATNLLKIQDILASDIKFDANSTFDIETDEEN